MGRHQQFPRSRSRTFPGAHAREDPRQGHRVLARLCEDSAALIRVLQDEKAFLSLKKYDSGALEYYWNYAISISPEEKPLHTFVGNIISASSSEERVPLLLEASRFCLDHMYNGKQARLLAEKAYGLIPRKADSDNPLYIPVMIALSEAFLMEEDISGAFRTMMELLDSEDIDPDQQIDCRRILGEILAKKGMKEEALRELDSALWGAKIRHGRESEEYLRCLISGGCAYRDLGMNEESSKILINATLLSEMVLGILHRLHLSSQLEAAYSFFLKGETEHAMEWALDSEAPFEEAEGAYKARWYLLMGTILFRKWRYHIARDYFERGVLITENHLLTGSVRDELTQMKDRTRKKLRNPLTRMISRILCGGDSDAAKG